MTKDDVKLLAVALLAASAVLFTGFLLGYMHVITRSEAYALDGEHTLILTVDGHMYQHTVSQHFQAASFEDCAAHIMREDPH